MKYVQVFALHPVENLVYRALWLFFLCAWLGGLVAIFVLPMPELSIGVSVLGWVGASVFGHAVKDQMQVWPFSRFWPKPILKETKWDAA
ncbi:hypothetical protein [Ideonella sp.]|uniref:hypothetical protein n=1 Tax=Ideonella sp. TaxID=1929293 RepID=UPI003BB620D7